MQTLTTPRLVLRLADADDASFIQTLYNTPDFLRYIGDKQIRSLQDARRYIADKILAMREEYGVCLLVVEDRQSNAPLGVCGLIKRPDLPAYDIGYGYLPSTYRQGIGYEAGQAVMEYARRRADIEQVVAITSSDNLASQALLVKLGFSYRKIQSQLSESVDLLLYQQDTMR